MVADSLSLPPRPRPGTHPLPPGARVSSLQVQILMIIYSITSWCRAGPRSNLLASEIQIDLIRLVRLYLPIPPLTVLNQNIQLTLENHSYIEKLLAIFLLFVYSAMPAITRQEIVLIYNQTLLMYELLSYIIFTMLGGG